MNKTKFSISNNFFEEINSNFYTKQIPEELVKTALELLKWSILEISNGNKIISEGKNGSLEIIFPFQSNIKTNK
jgi:hypothetical protein